MAGHGEVRFVLLHQHEAVEYRSVQAWDSDELRLFNAV